MSPGKTLDHADEDKQIQALAKGFDALLVTTRKLLCQEQELRKRLQFAHDEVCSRRFSFFIPCLPCLV